MSDPGIAVNPTQLPNDILLRLLGATEEIRDLLRTKSDEEKKTAQETDYASRQGADSPPEDGARTQESLHAGTANVVTTRENDWPNDETIARYKDRCAKHKSECEKMQVELGCFIAHLGIVGGNEDVIEYAESLRKALLGPVQCLESALGVIPRRRQNAMREVRDSIDILWYKIGDFYRGPNHDGALYHNKFKGWKNIAHNGWNKIRELVRKGKFVNCLEFIHDELFTDLETAMSDVIEALTAFEEKWK